MDAHSSLDGGQNKSLSRKQRQKKLQALKKECDALMLKIEPSIRSYKVRADLQEIMNILKTECDDFLPQAGALKVECYVIHPEKDSDGVPERLNKNPLADCQPKRFKKIAVHESIFDQNGFTLTMLYEDWHRMISRLVEKRQQGAAEKDLAEDLLEILDCFSLENNSAVETKKRGSADRSTNEVASRVYPAYRFRFLIALVFCVTQALSYFSTEERNECVENPLECIQNIVSKLFLKVYSSFTAFYVYIRSSES